MAQAPHRLAVTPSKTAGSLLHGSVLIVDDEREIADALRVYLQGRLAPDVSVRSTTDPMDALASLRGLPPDVIVTDYNMPGLDGLAFLAKAREVCPGAVRIMMSAFGDRELVLRAVNEAHVHAFAPKPIDPERMAAQVAAGLLTRAQARLLDQMLHTQDEVVRDLLGLLGRNTP